MPNIILASKSPRRIKFLKDLGLKFQIKPSNIDETTFYYENLPPEEIAKKIALEKAKSIAKDVREGIIVGADTIVVLGKEILGKPEDKNSAKKMLKKLSNTTHKVITGLAIVGIDGKILVDSETTLVTMREMDDKEIEEYVNTGEPLDAAGAYKIQEKGDKFITKIEGDYENIVGLPLAKFKKMLKNFYPVK